MINNFSVGILGMIIAIIGYFIIGSVMTAILMVLSKGVEVLIAHSLCQVHKLIRVWESCSGSVPEFSHSPMGHYK